jgi:hypothetical protein
MTGWALREMSHRHDGWLRHDRWDIRPSCWLCPLHLHGDFVVGVIEDVMSTCVYGGRGPAPLRKGDEADPREAEQSTGGFEPRRPLHLRAPETGPFSRFWCRYAPGLGGPK